MTHSLGFKSSTAISSIMYNNSQSFDDTFNINVKSLKGKQNDRIQNKISETVIKYTYIEKFLNIHHWKQCFNAFPENSAI